MKLNWKNVTEIRTLLHFIRKWNAHNRNIFYQRIQKEGDIIKVFATDLKLKSNKGMRKVKERGKETAWVSDKRRNHIKDESREWNSRKTKNWQWKILKDDNLLYLIRQGNHQVQDEVLFFTINAWKILKFMRFLQLLTIFILVKIFSRINNWIKLSTWFSLPAFLFYFLKWHFFFSI